MDTQKFKLTITRENRNMPIVKIGTLEELVEYTHFILKCGKNKDEITTPNQLKRALAHGCPHVHYYIEPVE